MLLSGNFWFRPGPVAVRANSTWWSTDEDTLEIINQSSNNNGSDAIGSFTSCEYTWKAVSNASTAVDLQVRTYINVYDDVPVATFAIAYITAANDTAIPGVYDRTVSSFPSFIIEENPARRGYATWAGNSRSAHSNLSCSQTPLGKIDFFEGVLASFPGRFGREKTAWERG